MVEVRSSLIPWTIPVLLLVCLSNAPAHGKYSGGTGEPNDPYQIATAEDLITLGETPEDYDKHFVLTADIDLDPNLPGRKVFDKAVIAPDPWVCSPSGSCNRVGASFAGVFDGSGHTVFHMTIKGGGCIGLFGVLGKSAEIRNLAVVDVNIAGSSEVGGLVGLNCGRLTRCRTTGTIAGWGECVGGLVGQNGNQWDLVTPYEHGVLTECFSMTVVSGNGGVGGLVGTNGGTIEASWAGGAVTGKESVGGLVGENADFPPWIGIRLEPGRILNCYSSCSVVGESLVGGLVGDNFVATVSGCYSVGAVTGTAGGYAAGGLVGNNSWGPGNYGSSDGAVIQCFWDIQTSGLPTSSGGTGKTTAEMQDPNTFMAAGWDFVSQPDGPHDIWAEPEGGGYPILWWQLPPMQGVPRFSGGTGAPNDPYRISTAKDLNSIGYNPRLIKCHFKLVVDLELAGTKFYPIGSTDYPYGSVFDGNGHTVSHLTINSEGHAGLFGCVGEQGEVRDLGVVDVNITGPGGGLVGDNYGTLIDCYSAGKLSGGSPVGGLLAYNAGTVVHCYSTAAVHGSGTSDESAWWRGGIGGLAGLNDGTMIRCYSTGTVDGDSCVGGLVGSNSGAVTECYSAGKASGGGPVGGLVGANWSGGTVVHCYSTAAVHGTGTNNESPWWPGGIGGLVGRAEQGATVAQCYSTGAVSGISDDYLARMGRDYVGGLVGYNPCGTGVADSFWDVQTSGQKTTVPPWEGTGKTTAEMQTESTFTEAGWDFVGETANGTEDIWWILEGRDYPRLWWEATEE